MQTRRSALALTSGLLVSLSGCLGNSSTADGSGATPSDRSTESLSPAPAGTLTVAGTDAPPGTDEGTRTGPRTTPDTVTRVTGELPAWRADRWFDADYANVLGLDSDGSRLSVTMSDEDGGSAVASTRARTPG